MKTSSPRAQVFEQPVIPFLLLELGHPAVRLIHVAEHDRVELLTVTALERDHGTAPLIERGVKVELPQVKAPSIESDDKKLVLAAPDDYKLKAMWDVLQSKMVRRQVPLKNLKPGKVEPAAHPRVELPVPSHAAEAAHVPAHLLRRRRGRRGSRCADRKEEGAVLQEAGDLFLAAAEERHELGDVRTDDEDVLAARHEDATQSLRALQLADRRLQLADRQRVELVDGVALQVESQLDETAVLLAVRARGPAAGTATQ